jgi:predicted Zn-dependent protease
LAAARADVKHAETIFGALALLRPDRNFSYIGLAMAYLNSDRHEEAVGVLARGEKVVRVQDKSELHSVRALALQMAGRTAESLRALREAGPNRLAQAMQGHRIIEPKEY